MMDVLLTAPAEPDGASILTLTDGEGPPRRYAVAFSECGSPFCECMEVGLALTPLDGGSPVQITVDLETQAPSAKRPRSAFAEAVTAGLDLDAWGQIFAAFVAGKGRAIDAVDPRAAIIPFDVAAVESGGLVSYVQVFPYAPELDVVIDGARFCILDHYCVRLGCPCKKVVVALATVDADGGVHPEDTPHVFQIDYGTRFWMGQTADGSASEIHLDAMNALVAQHPDLMERIAARHEVLQTLYATSRARRATPKAPGRAKVGRNDPCPCGSGQKHKRCCGR